MRELLRVVLEFIFGDFATGLGVALLIGAGFTLPTDEYKRFKAARVCFWLAALWILGKVLMWGFFTPDSFRTRALVSFLVFGFVGICLTEVLHLVGHRESIIEPPKSDSPKPPSPLPQALPPTALKKSPSNKSLVKREFLTLMGLFLTDFRPNLFRTRYDTTLTIGSKTGTFQPVTVKFISQLWVDLREGTQFLGFYIPMQDKDPEESSKKTVLLCRNLPNSFPEILKHLQGMQVSASNERGSMYKSTDLPISSRIYIYHEDFMSPQDTGDLVREYEARQFLLEFRGSEYRAKQELLRAVQHPQIDQQIDPEISKLRADATSLINRIYRRFADTNKNAMSILSGPAPDEKKRVFSNIVWGRFSEEYDKDFKQEVLDVHKALLGHIRTLPSKSDSSIEETYKVYPQPPGFPKRMFNAVEIEMQLGDLRSLLNEMERENNLPLSCQDLVLRFGP